MPQIIDVPGQGLVEFPDSMSDDDIVAAIRRNSAPPKAGASDRVQAVGSGVNSGIAGLAGLPVDTALNVVDLVTAGLGYGASKFNKGQVPDAFALTNRASVPGSSEWLRQLGNKTPVTTTQANRPDDAASQYLHTAGSALPGALLMRPSTIGQGFSAATANLAPALASKATADLSKGTDYESTAPILANLLVQTAFNRSSGPQKQLTPEKLATLREGQKEGLVVPPSTTNPTITNRLLESYAGKRGTEQDARSINESVFDSLAKRSLGMGDGAPLNKGVTNNIRKDAGKAYENVKQSGTIVADKQYLDSLDKIRDTNANEKVSKVFPSLAKPGVSSLIDELKQPQFDAEVAIEATKALRDKAGDLFASGQKSEAKAHISASTEIENLVQRNLAQSIAKARKIEDPKAQAVAVRDAQKRLEAFREARKQIAKTYTVDKALNDATGSIDARRFARQEAIGRRAKTNRKVCTRVPESLQACR